MVVFSSGDMYVGTEKCDVYVGTALSEHPVCVRNTDSSSSRELTFVVTFSLTCFIAKELGRLVSLLGVNT